MQRHLTAVSWCGIFILCLSVCFQLLGVPGTMFNVADSEDDFQASITGGYTITTAPVSFLPRLTSFSALSENPSVSAFLGSDIPFHPPLFI